MIADKHASPSCHVPVIAIDGPSASGKGTIAQLVASQLGYHYLDSGALYRLLALAARHHNVSWQDAAALAALATQLHIRFDGTHILLNDIDVTDAVRSEAIGRGASEIAVLPAVRSALLALQHSFRRKPGLVADGRDMATVVFPDAKTKIFLTASAEVRAERRHKQLMAKGIDVKLTDILHDLQQRDARDSQRSNAPLQRDKSAELLETSHLSIEEAVQFVINAAKKHQK